MKLAQINDPGSPYRPNVKVAHRAYPNAVVDLGNHTWLTANGASAS